MTSLAHKTTPKTWGFLERKFKKAESKRLSPEDMEIVESLRAVKSDMEFLHNCFDHTTDAILIDSLTYEIKALHLRYEFYLSLCKEKGIVHGFRV